MKHPPPTWKSRWSRGFTLLELLVSISILLILSSLLFGAFNQASKAWVQAENQVDTFQSARAALDFMGKELSQAIVTTNFMFLANINSVAFVAPVSDGPTDGPDLAKIVYRLNYVQTGTIDSQDIGGNNAPPFKLLRRSAVFTSTAANCWDYGLGAPCGISPWNFYNFAADENWPEKSDRSRTVVLAENIVSLNFNFTANIGNGGTLEYWISETNSTADGRNYWNDEIGPNGINLIQSAQAGQQTDAQKMQGHTPAGVEIVIGAIDARSANRLTPIINANGTSLAPPGPLAQALAGNSAYVNITNNAIRYFSTYVAIPNRPQ